MEDFGFITDNSNKPTGGRPKKICQFTVRAANHTTISYTNNTHLRIVESELTLIHLQESF